MSCSRTKSTEAFYDLQEAMNEDLNVRLGRYEEHRQLLQAKVKSKELPVHVQGILIAALKKDVECPVCYQVLNREAPGIQVTLCGHIFCKPCHKQLKACALCRKPIQH